MIFCRNKRDFSRIEFLLPVFMLCATSTVIGILNALQYSTINHTDDISSSQLPLIVEHNVTDYDTHFMQNPIDIFQMTNIPMVTMPTIEDISETNVIVKYQCQRSSSLLGIVFDTWFTNFYASIYGLSVVLCIAIYCKILLFIFRNGRKMQNKCASRSRRIRELRKNAKVDFMMGLVCFVFISAFLPAWLMKLKIVPMCPIVFNSYFFSYALNPIIYVLFSKNVRKNLRALFPSN